MKSDNFLHNSRMILANEVIEGIIDRFEGELAVIETGHDMIKVERKNLPADAREGNLLKKQGTVWVIDQAAGALRQQQIDKLAEELWEDD